MAHVFASKNKYKRIFRFEWTGCTLAAVEGKKPKVQDHHHGLSQGDPLSPLFFILVMDVISLVLAKVAEAGGLLQPLSPVLSSAFYLGQHRIGNGNSTDFGRTIGFWENPSLGLDVGNGIGQQN